MTLLDSIFIGGIIFATGCFNVAIVQLSKVCNKPYYLITRSDLLGYLFMRHANNDLVTKYKRFMYFSIVNALVAFIVGLIQLFLQK